VLYKKPVMKQPFVLRNSPAFYLSDVQLVLEFVEHLGLWVSVLK
jgi:hypothetical protein